jgi:hypothetical protein
LASPVLTPSGRSSSVCTHTHTHTHTGGSTYREYPWMVGSSGDFLVQLPQGNFLVYPGAFGKGSRRSGLDDIFGLF